MKTTLPKHIVQHIVHNLTPDDKRRISFEICDEEIPTYKDARGNIRMDPAAASRMRVRVNTRRWLITLLTAHRDKTSRSTQTATATTSPQRTPPAQRPRPSVGHPLDNPQAPALPATPSPLFRQARSGKLPFPMSKTGFQLYAAYKDGELDAQKTPAPLAGPIASTIPTPPSMPKKSPSSLSNDTLKPETLDGNNHNKRHLH